MRLALSLLLLLCLLVLGGSPTDPSLAEAHTVTKQTACKAKRGHAKRTCMAKARRTTCRVKAVRKTKGGKVTRTRVCTKRTRRHVHVRASGSKQCTNNKSRACRPAPEPAPAPAPAPEPAPAPAPAPEPAPAPAPAPQPAPAPAPEPAPAPAPEPAPAPTPAPPAIDLQPITAWRAAGAAPLSDLDAASRVRPAVETRLQNAVANAYRPTASEIQAFLTGQRDTYGRLPTEYNPALAKVTGNFAGTTDEILQWAAHKWGIPEDIARAVAVTESYWRQDGYGDRMTVSNPLLYPAQSRISGTSDVYESLGIMQVKWRPDGSVGTGTEPLRWKSTAFNADFWAATVRYYYDGACSWCDGTYSPGQEKASVGAWYSPYPWGNAGQQEYATKVWNHAADRTWARLGF